MNTSVLIFGIVCVIAAIVGGNVKAAAMAIPVIKSGRRQIALGCFGGILIVGSQLSKIDLSKIMSRTQEVTPQGPLKPQQPSVVADTVGQKSEGKKSVKVVPLRVPKRKTQKELAQVASSQVTTIPVEQAPTTTVPVTSAAPALSLSCPAPGKLKTAWTLLTGGKWTDDKWADGGGWGIRYSVDTNGMAQALSGKLGYELQGANAKVIENAQIIRDELRSLGFKVPTGPFSTQYGELKNTTFEQHISCSFSCTSLQWEYWIRTQDSQEITSGGNMNIPISGLSRKSKDAIDSIGQWTRPDADMRCIKAVSEL